MTFLAPGFLLAAFVAAGVVTGLHFLVTRPPVRAWLPTARFIPDAAVTIRTFARRPEDLRLLALRVLALLLAGAAFARPVRVGPRMPLVRIILADRSRAVARPAEVADSVRALRAPADLVIAFDRAPTWLAPDSLGGAGQAPVRGALAPALVAALRAASAVGRTADSLELVLISPLVAEEWDAAVPALRALWPGRARLVRVTARHDTLPARAGVLLGAGVPEPLATLASVAGLGGGAAPLTRLISDPPGAADTAWAAAGGVVLQWATVGAPAAFEARAVPDTVGAVAWGEEALVQAFPRHWRPRPAAAGTRVVARWVDGEPLALERPLGRGCVRELALPLPARGDLVLRPALGRLLGHLAGPCGDGAPGAALPEEAVRQLAGAGPLAAGRSFPPEEAPPSPLVPWLLGLALAALAVEQWLRHGRRSRPAVDAA